MLGVREDGADERSGENITIRSQLSELSELDQADSQIGQSVVARCPYYAGRWVLGLLRGEKC